MSEEKKCNTNQNDIVSSVSSRNDWTRNNWIDKIIVDYFTGEQIGFILNNGSQLTEAGLTTLLLKESVGCISIRGDFDSCFILEPEIIEGIQYVSLKRKVTYSQLLKFEDIYVKGFVSGICLGEPAGLIGDTTKTSPISNLISFLRVSQTML